MIEKISDFLYNLRHGLRAVFKWLPVIWKDRQWDDYFVFRVMRHKLSLMVEYWTNNPPVQHEGMESSVRDMRVCISLIDKIIDDNFCKAEYEELDKKWGKSEMVFGEPDQNGYCELDLVRPNAKTEQEKQQERQEWRVVHELENQRRAKAKRLLFKILHDKIEHWWI